MSDTVVAPNNRAIAFRGRAQRERPRATASSPTAAAGAAANTSRGSDAGSAVAKLKKRGLISDRAAERHLGGLDQQPIDASSR